jgi:putative ABC transport system permease protein
MRYAVRLFLKAPGFTTVAVVSLALGIGANTLMFSIVHAVLIRSLPYPDSDRLVFVWFTPPNHPDQKRASSAANFFALRDENRVLEHVGTVGGVEDTANFTGGPEAPEQVDGQRFSAEVPRALGAKPLLGRWFTEAEAETEARSVIVIGYRLWQRRFHGAADVLGKIVRIDGEAAAIIGVMPDGWMLFNYPAQFWAPYRLGAAARGSPERVLPLARLKPGVTMRQAQAEMNRFAAGLAEAFPATNKGWGIRLEPALDVYVGWVRQPLLIVQGVVALVLLIACANVAGLLLAQAAGRKQELAVRAALGGGRWRIARQFLTESVLLSLAGGLLGMALAYGGLKLFVAISPAWFPRVGEVVLDIRTLGFTALLSLATGLLFGIVPALQASGPDLMETMKGTSRGASAGIGRQRIRSALVVLEVSVALVLLTGAGLMLNTFLRLYNAPTGFDIRNLVTFQMRLPAAQFVKDSGVTGDNQTVEISPRVNAVFERIRERVSALPGVRSVAAGVLPPLGESTLGALTLNFTIEGRRADGSEQQPMSAAWFPVSAGYFHTLGAPLIRGREFRNQDTAASLPAVLINEAMARRYWRGEDPIGKRLRIDMANEPSREIVGVVSDIRHNRHSREAQPQMYVPYVQHRAVSPRRFVEARLSMTFVVRSAGAVRSAGDPLRLAPALRAAAAEVDRNVPIFNIKAPDEYSAEQLWQPRQTVTLLGIFSGIAVILAMTGVYGIIACMVRQRTHEIGIRMALGARPGDLLRLAMVRGLRLVALGVAIGVAGSLALTRVLGSLLWGVTPADPLTYAVAITALVTAAMLACYLPARRALEIEPTMALRYE